MILRHTVKNDFKFVNSEDTIGEIIKEYESNN